jgi:hypothetical protein
MRLASFIIGIGAFLVCGSTASLLQAQSAKPTPLILEKNDQTAKSLIDMERQ